MNTSQLAGILRAILTAVAGYAAGKGIDLTGVASPEVTGAIVTVAVAVWSVFAKRKAATPVQE